MFSDEHHREHSNSEQQVLLQMWKGNLAETLREAAAKKQLTDWLMGMAPMGKKFYYYTSYYKQRYKNIAINLKYVWFTVPK